MIDSKDIDSCLTWLCVQCGDAISRKNMMVVQPKEDSPIMVQIKMMTIAIKVLREKLNESINEENDRSH